MIKLALIAQLGLGLTNFGPLATEVDHRVRALSTPGSLTLNVTHRYRYVTIGMSITPTSITRSKCAEGCYPGIGRFTRDLRPDEAGDSLVAEWDVIFVIPRAGFHVQFGTAFLSGGVALPLLQAPYNFVGPSPMATPAVWGEAQLGSLYFLLTYVPPSRYRWTSLSEWSGHKQRGQPFPNWPGTDPQRVMFFELGFRK